MDKYGGENMSNEEMEVNSKIASEEEKRTSEEMHYDCHVPPITINSDLEVNIGSKNKIIYVFPGRLQYFTASVLSDSCNKTIEMEYCGCNVKCICGETVIYGCLGYYKIVESGIIFIPYHKLYKLQNELFPTDILSFIVKDKCNNEKIIYDVVFTYARCIDCNKFVNSIK